jgi:branched-chain amino acid transport system ATP-binding protein
MSALLEVSNLSVAYGSALAVDGASLEINEGEIRVILGANGAGKSTIIKTLLGLIRPKGGSVQYDGGRDLTKLKPHQIHGLGIAWVPEGRRLWGSLTVLENLRMGAFAQTDRTAIERDIGAMFDRFPRLGERRHQLAGSLSGGEQQMVAIARALVAKPRLLLMDEPSVGLAPLVVRDIFALVSAINREGISVLMVEQNARQALELAHWAYLLEIGRIVESGPARELAGKERVKEVFLGGA